MAGLFNYLGPANMREYWCCSDHKARFWMIAEKKSSFMLMALFNFWFGAGYKFRPRSAQCVISMYLKALLNWGLTLCSWTSPDFREWNIHLLAPRTGACGRHLSALRCTEHGSPQRCRMHLLFPLLTAALHLICYLERGIAFISCNCC